MKIKICIMSVFLSLLLLFSKFSVKANEVIFPSFPSPVEDMSTTHYLILINHETETYYLIKPLDPAGLKVIYNYTYDNYRIYFDTSAIIYKWKAGETSWETYREINSYGEFIFANRLEYRDGIKEFLYSSFDLFYSDGELFFQRAPIKANFLTQMRAVEMGATMMTVVSLIPLLIPLLVFLIGFRKAWAWFSKVLRKA